MDLRTIYSLTAFALIGAIGYMSLIQLSTPGLKGFRWIIAGYSCSAAGMELIARRNEATDHVSILFSTLFLVLGNVFAYQGIASLLGAKKRLNELLAGSLLPILIFTSYFIYVRPNLAYRIEIYSGISLVQNLLLAALLLRNGSKRTRAPRFGLANLFVLWSIAHLLRAIYTMHQMPKVLADETRGATHLVIFGPLVIGGLTTLGLLWLAMAQLQSELETQSHTDILTGLPNRRALEKMAQREIELATRTRTSLALVICDLDHFKSVNDRFGHDGGDIALTAIGRCILSGLRPLDVVARLGGEEFVVLLPNTPQEHGIQIAERIRTLIANEAIPHRQGLIRLTASFGVAILHPEDRDWEDIFARADKALYRAKAEGRDRTVGFDQRLRDRRISGIGPENRSMHGLIQEPVQD